MRVKRVSSEAGSSRQPEGSEPRDHRDKSATEKEIEGRWRQVLLEGASSEDFRRAYDELHTEFIGTQGEVGDIYGEVNPRSEVGDRVRAVVLRHIGSGSRVLEVGTGDGTTAYLLAHQGNSVVSADVSRIALERARSRWGGDPNQALRFEFGDARALDYPDASFDFVLSENLVEHISLDDMREHLRQVRRVLVPGGGYLLYTPSRLWNGRISVGFHLHVYTLRQVCRLLHSFGFRPVWLEPRLVHRMNRLYPISGLGLQLVGLVESVLSALRVHAWPICLKARIIPSIMVCGRVE